MAVSVIVPTLNEAGHIQKMLASLRQQRAGEIIVVDGGSRDGTAELARDADLVLSSSPGRALQMNAGASRARGEVLLFLHADCTLGNGALAAAEKALHRSRIVGGCFSMRVQAEGWLYRSIDACATARVRLTGIIYGDQGLFLRRSDFETLGGFPQVLFLEDVLFSMRLRQLGKATVLPDQIGVSPRRWHRMGLVRQTLRNWTLTALAAAGVSPDWLARFYPVIR